MQRQQQTENERIIAASKQYYTAIIQFPDPDRLAKLLELGNPNLFDGGSSSNFVRSNFVKSNEPKLSSASLTYGQSENRLSKLLELGEVNFFGGSPLAEALAARQRGNRWIRYGLGISRRYSRIRKDR